MMRTAKMGLLLLAGAAFMTTGCAASLKSYPYTMMDSHVGLKPLRRKDYKVLGSVEGTAHCAGLFVCVPDGVDKDKVFTGVLTSVSMMAGQADQSAAQHAAFAKKFRPQANADLDEEPSTVLGPLEQAALYKAMESQPDADGIINLVVTKGTSNHIFIWVEETVTVRATAIKIKNG